ncbi:tetratricopeptide repeat protein [Streptomyces xinghaiensis]|uniref:serine/threonine-protein kinase n=1 Tax=Streptomyces xinghaiensis TaxID=1038928 RepID=UPI002E167892|nr:tetratricopeptide repeat protein [Streptomyces xinghaiensis]
MEKTGLVRGRYRLLERIGRGGMGEVWRALDESLGRQVAVKCLKPLGPELDEQSARVLRERFRREARVAASLQHRGITVVHDFGEDDGVLHLVMELLDGRHLGQVLEDNGHHPLPLPDLVDVTEQIAAALAYTHRQGVVHRDLKPANIVRLADGTLKICDFGIARLARDMDPGSRLTSAGIAMGTPHYMSPEQISGGSADHRSDLYSLGCVLYELATGTPPFDQEDAWSVLVGHRDTTPRPLRDHRPELPEPFERLVLDLLAKDPDDRPGDAAELGDRLAAARYAHPAGSPVPLDEPYEPRLPAWTRGMTTGSKAVGALARATPPDVSTGLTGPWTGRTGPTATGPPPQAPGRPPPPSGAAAALARRHVSGLTLARHGRWAEAATTHRAVAAERERILGPDHPDTLASRYEAGTALLRAGRPAEALAEYEHVAELRQRALGPDHPATLLVRQDQAHVLGRLGRDFEAHQLYAAVLAARERADGPGHPDTLRCRHNLAVTLGRLGRAADSYRTASEVAAARSRILGPDHPDTLTTRHEVAHALGQLGRWADALRVYREIAAARRRVLGPLHPDTLAARHEEGVSLGRLGRGAEALELYRDLVEQRTRAGGPEDPGTLRARHGVGVNLGRLGRWPEALIEAREVCAVRERVLGPEHPDTLSGRREIAVCLGWLGRWEDALDVYRRVARDRENVLGPGHPDSLASRGDEAHCLEQLGRSAEAVEIYRRLAGLRGGGPGPG